MRLLINNFSRGLVDEELSLRNDLPSYNNALIVAENVTHKLYGAVVKRAGTSTILEHEGYKKVYNFRNLPLYIGNTTIEVGAFEGSHPFMNTDIIQVITTKDTVFILEPYVTLRQLKYFENTDSYEYKEFEFTHPALTDDTSEETRTPGTNITLSKLTGNDVLITATQYLPYNPATTYFLNDICTLNVGGHKSVFKLIIAEPTKGIPPVDIDYFEINTAYWERQGADIHPTWDSTFNYSIIDRVYYKGKYYSRLGAGISFNEPPDTSTAVWQENSNTLNNVFLSSFSIDDVGNYVKTNQGIIRIKQVLDVNGDQATIFTENTKAIGDFLHPAVANTAEKDAWFISMNALPPSKIAAIALVQQRLVLSRDDVIYFSKTGDFNWFLQTNVSFTADAFSVKAYSTITTKIKYLSPWRNGIIAYTDRSLLYVYSETIMSALNMRAEETVATNPNDCEPVQVYGDMFYVSTNKLRTVVYSRENGGLISNPLTDHFTFDSPVIKIEYEDQYLHVLTQLGTIYCILYHKLGEIAAISKHIYHTPIIDIVFINDVMYLLTANKVLLRNEGLYTDETSVTREVGQVGYNNTLLTVEDNPNVYGYIYDVLLETVNIDTSILSKTKLTIIDEVSIIQDVVCRVIDTSNILINNQDPEITNGYTGSVRVYESKKVSNWASAQDNEDEYRVNIKSTSPFNFYLKAISINVT